MKMHIFLLDFKVKQQFKFKQQCFPAPGSPSFKRGRTEVLTSCVLMLLFLMLQLYNSHEPHNDIFMPFLVLSVTEAA